MAMISMACVLLVVASCYADVCAAASLLEPDSKTCPSLSSEDMLETTAKDAQVGFLQQRALLSKRVSTPFAYLHVPKNAGHEFMVSFLRLPGVCPNLSNADFQVLFHPDLDELQNNLQYLSDHLSGQPEDLCEGLADMRDLGINFGGHIAINAAYYSSFYIGSQGHGFIMLRQPEQRLLSEYNYERDHIKDGVSEKDYAEVHAGCTVKLLTRTGTPCFSDSTPDQPPSDDEVSLAVRRLRDGFAFVGLVEEYDLSTCLLHAMFGGKCSVSEFQDANVGPNRKSNNSGYDVSALEGFTDIYDGALWQEGRRIFHQELQTFAVSTQSCQACWAAR